MMESGPGKLRIFNQLTFNKPFFVNGEELAEDLDDRSGTLYDVISLQEAFNLFGVENSVHNDLSYEQIQQKALEFAQEDFSKNSCCVFVFLTHGFRQNFIAARDKAYNFNDIILTISTNITLKSKPKIYIIQACRGFIDPLDKFRTDGPNSSYCLNRLESNIEYNCEETYILHSSTECFTAYRDESTGSPFIQNLCKFLKKYGSTKSIEAIFRETAKSVHTESAKCQHPTIEVNAVKPYIFGEHILDKSSLMALTSISVPLTLSAKVLELIDDDEPAGIENKSKAQCKLFNEIPPVTKLIHNVLELFDIVTANKCLYEKLIGQKLIGINTGTKKDHHWIKYCGCTHCVISEEPVPGGLDIDGEVMYIGRARFGNDLLPAKCFLEKGYGFVPFCMREYKVTDFEVLVGDGYHWVQSARGHVPTNAVIGGITDDGEHLYIGRVPHDISVTIGKIQPSHKFCYIPFDGLEIRFFNYEVLVR